MEFKDYYQILGLDKSASQDDIKKAYRKLARRYHPDVSKEADAAARMAEVNEANTVLSDPEKRAAYDALGREAPHRAGQDNMRSFLKRMRDHDREYGFLLDDEKHFVGVISADSLKEAIIRQEPIRAAVLPDFAAVKADTPIRDMLNTAAQFPCPVPVVDAQGRHIGSVSKVALLETLSPPEE